MHFFYCIIITCIGYLFVSYTHYFLWYIHYELFLNMRCKILVSYKKIIMCFKRWQIPVVLLTKVLWPDAEDLVLTKSVHQADQVSIIIISTIPNQCMNCTHNYFWFFPHFLPDYDKQHTGGETGQQRMFPPPWQLIVA